MGKCIYMCGCTRLFMGTAGFQMSGECWRAMCDRCRRRARRVRLTPRRHGTEFKTGAMGGAGYLEDGHAKVFAGGHEQ